VTSHVSSRAVALLISFPNMFSLRFPGAYVVDTQATEVEILDCSALLEARHLQHNGVKMELIPKLVAPCKA
jgi:hypothetical protein